MSNLKIIQLNTESIKSNKDLLEKFIFDNNIDIGIFSETWTKNTDEINFTNYNLHLNNRHDGYGGVGILVRNNLHSSFKKLNIYKPIEAIEADISNNNFNIKIISFYAPPNIDSNTIDIKFTNLIMNYENHQNIIIAGDINAHNNLWELNSHTDSKGRIIANIITDSKLILHNDGTHTFQDTFHHTTSAIDITLSSPNLSLNWKVENIKLGSKHFPIVLEIENHLINRTYYKTIINWENLKSQIETSDMSNTKDIFDFENLITTIITNNSKIIKTKHSPKPWWNNHINRLWIIKKEKQTIYNRNKSHYTAIELRKATSKLKITIKKYKRESWLQFIDSINPDCSSKEIWDKINKFKGRHKYQKNNFFNIENNMEEFLSANFQSQNIEIRRQIRIVTPIEDDLFKPSEIQLIIRENKNSTPGLDKISNKLLKFLTYPQIVILTNHLNKIWISQNFPNCWKKIQVVAIKKLNKDSNNISGYRPICLLPVILKLFNKLIKTRINKFINENKIIPKSSYGFQKRKCTTDLLANVIYRLEQNKIKKLKSLMIFIDVEKAFDNININKLLIVLEKLNFKPEIINWLQQFLTDRKIMMYSENKRQSIISSKGLPQGSVLSPILFNIFTSSIHQLTNNFKNKVELLQYADDFSIIISDRNIEKLFSTANLFLNSLNQALNNLNLHLNGEKCKFMFFGNHNLNNFNIKLNGVCLEKLRTINFLGITLDPKLKFNKHYELAKQKNMSYINLLKIFSKAMGGAHPKIMINIYKSLIKSRYHYSFPITNINSKSLNEKIQTVYNNGIRICLGLTKSTPVSAIIAEAGELPVHLDNELVTTRYMSRQIYYDSDIGKKIRKNVSTEKFNQLMNKYPIMKQIPKMVNYNLTDITNLRINTEFFINSKNMNENSIAKCYCELMNKYKQHSKIYTDGSKSQLGSGLGIIFDDKNIHIGEISKNIQEKISIKCIEIIAIHLALKIAIQLKLTKIIILTDSKSSCESIKNSMRKRSDKYYESEIIRLAQQFPQLSEIVIQYIPAHKGIIGNERADRAAKVGATSNNILTNLSLPPTEVYCIVRNMIYEAWAVEFREITRHKGIYHSKIIQSISRQPWFINKPLNSKNIKTITRLRTGHSYNKKFLHLIGKEITPYCLTCNEIEDNKHILKSCKLYDNIRLKYQCLNNKSIEEILINNNDQELIQICAFLTEIKYNL